MGIVIDIIIVLLVAFCTYRGYKKGLIGVAYSIIAFFVAILIAWMLVNPVSEFVIAHTDFNDRLQSSIENKLVSQDNKQNSETTTNAKEDTTFNFGDYIDKFIQNSKNEGAKAVAEKLSVLVIKVVTFIALYILARLVLLLFKSVANLIAKLPIIKQFNKLGGIVFGCLKGLIIVYFVLVILLAIHPMAKDFVIYSGLEKSFIGNVMYNNNFILYLIK